MNRIQQKTNPSSTSTGTVLFDVDHAAIRLAKGESWNQSAVQLAMLMTSDSYRAKMPGRLQLCDEEDDQQETIRPMIIRSNSFRPEFEPSRHEMRVFDDLDGIVTEM